MIKHIIAIALVSAACPQAALAQAKRPVDVGEYCQVLEKRIVALANTAANANDDLAKSASDQPAADPAKFARTNALSTLTESLKQKETEWHHLGCSHILYSRSASN